MTRLSRVRAARRSGDDTGASVVEYGLIVAALCAVLIVVAFVLRTTLSSTFTSAQTSIGRDQASLILNHVGALQPTGLTANPGNAQLELNWDDMLSSTSYTVSGCGPTTPIDVTDSTYICTGLTNGTLYTISVTASGPGGTSPPSTTTGTPIAPPSTPTGVGTLETPTTTTVSWTSVSGATSYNVYGCGAATGSPPAIPVYVVLAPATTYACARPTGSDYSVQISAVNGGGESLKSTAVTVRAKPPASPSTPTITYLAGNTTATIGWGSVSGATTYKVYGCGAVAVTVSSGSSYDCARPAVGAASYTVTVTALNAGGESTPSGSAAVLPRLGTPSTPTVSNLTAASATLTWSPAVAGAVYYTVTGCGSPITVNAPAVTTTCSRTPLADYTIFVTANNAGGASSPSGTVAIPAPAPAAPTTLTATAGDNQIVLNWDDMVGATSYSISGCGSTTAPSPASLSNATCTGVTNGSTYTVTVKAIGIGGPSTASTVTVTLPYRVTVPITVTRSNQNQLTSTWTGAPNPALPSGYSLSTCVDNPNSTRITCDVIGGNLNLNTRSNSPVGAVQLTWTFSKAGNPDIIYIIPFVINP